MWFLSAFVGFKQVSHGGQAQVHCTIAVLSTRAWNMNYSTNSTIQVTRNMSPQYNYSDFSPSNNIL